MSSFDDIAYAYDAYRSAGSWKNVRYGLIYTCNAGWIDLGHLNPESSRPLIGARNLWNRVRIEGPPANTRNYCVQPGPAPFGGRVQPSGCTMLAESGRVEFRFPGGYEGYEVRYRQDHGGYPGRPGVEGAYLVRRGLSDMQKKSVALSIFMRVSHRFETFQSRIGLWDWVTDSGYSQEDLVSNLLGFYIAVGEISKEEAILLAHPVSQSTAEAIWSRSGAVGENKNREFRPQFEESWTNDSAAQLCRDECQGQPRRFPSIFQSIRPAVYGTTFIQLQLGRNLSFN